VEETAEVSVAPVAAPDRLAVLKAVVEVSAVAVADPMGSVALLTDDAAETSPVAEPEMATVLLRTAEVSPLAVPSQFGSINDPVLVDAGMAMARAAA